MGEVQDIYGLLGRDLSHSYSPRVHELLGGYEYRLFEVEPCDVGAFLQAGGFRGLSVAMPYEEAVVPYCDALSDAARKIGCVNAIVRRDDGTLFGDNTDYYGFAHLMNKVGIDVEGRKVLVLGEDGVARAVRAALADRGASEVAVVGRPSEAASDELAAHCDADYIVNASMAGAYPNCSEAPIALEPFAREGELREGYADGLFGVIDVVYNPARTALALEAERLGVPFAGGLSMLVAQAASASELFFGTRIPESRIDDIARRLAFETSNIVLIGMPSGGKSTIGSLVAEKLGRTFVDIDDVIPSAAGKSIPEVFSEDGEDAFRLIETDVTRDVCKGSGLVVACGGGVVTRARNYALLHQNGIVVLLRRPLDLLISDGRPMSITKGVPRLARERAMSYARWADVAIDNVGTPELVADRVIESVLACCDGQAM